MVSPDTSRFIVGVVGNFVSFGLFASPVPTFWRIFKKKSVEEFSPVPYLATILNCVLWVFYGLVQPNSILVATINGIGLIIEIIYVATFFTFTDSKGRKRITIILAGEVLFTAIVVVLTLFVIHDVKYRSLLLGILCDIFNILMYASPLIVMKQVIQTKSVEYMPFWLSLTNFLNAGIWTAYALIRLDIYVLVSNSLGALAGAVQLILYACFYGSTKKIQSQKTTELELSGANAV